MIEFRVHELKRGDVFTGDNGKTWHVFDRFGKSIIKEHIVIVTMEGMTWSAKPLDLIVIK